MSMMARLLELGPDEVKPNDTEGAAGGPAPAQKPDRLGLAAWRLDRALTRLESHVTRRLDEAAAPAPAPAIGAAAGASADATSEIARLTAELRVSEARNRTLEGARDAATKALDMAIDEIRRVASQG